MTPRSPLAAVGAQAVGRTQIRVRRRQGEATVADVELSIFTDDRYIDLDGIVVREPRPGWTTIEIPPLEKWEKPMRWLLPEQRERIQLPDFFQLLQTHVAEVPGAGACGNRNGPQPATAASRRSEAARRGCPGRPGTSPAAKRPLRPSMGTTGIGKRVVG